MSGMWAVGGSASTCWCKIIQGIEIQIGTGVVSLHSPHEDASARLKVIPRAKRTLLHQGLCQVLDNYALGECIVGVCENLDNSAARKGRFDSLAQRLAYSLTKYHVAREISVAKTAIVF